MNWYVTAYGWSLTAFGAATTLLFLIWAGFGLAIGI